MPCSGDYMDQTHEELEHGRLLLVFDEVFNGTPVSPKKWADAGYDRRVYGHPMSAARRDEHVRALCQALRQHGAAFLRGLSLEAQMWFRDHQTADRERERAKTDQTRNWSA